MVSSEEILGERERSDVGVDGTEPEEKEELEGYASLYWLAASEGVEVDARSECFEAFEENDDSEIW